MESLSGPVVGRKASGEAAGGGPRVAPLLASVRLGAAGLRGEEAPLAPQARRGSRWRHPGGGVSDGGAQLWGGSCAARS